MSKKTAFEQKTLATFKNKEVYKGMYAGMFPFEFDSQEGEGGAASTIPNTIHLIPIGEWMHDAYGPITITTQDLREFIANFNAKVRKGVFITAGHEGWNELPAVGWIQKLELRDTGLWGEVEWNNEGIELLTDKAYKFFSPEFYRDYEDPQTHQIYRNVLTGGALTKSPYFKELEAIVFSDKNITKTFNSNTMNLNELLAKDITTLTDEEKAFIVANKEQLTDEQKTSHASILEVAPAVEEKKEEEVAEAETKPEGETAVAEDAEADEEVKPEGGAATEEAKPEAEVVAPATEQVTASELAKLTPQAFAELKAQAEAGKEAMKQIFTMKMDKIVGGLLFSESNQAGKFLPKSADNLRAFAETLNDAQLAAFTGLVSQLPDMAIFKEMGGESFNDSSVVAQVESLVAAKQKANDKLTYGDALKQVFAENKGLDARYNAELSPADK